MIRSHLRRAMRGDCTARTSWCSGRQSRNEIAIELLDVVDESIDRVPLGNRSPSCVAHAMTSGFIGHEREHVIRERVCVAGRREQSYAIAVDDVTDAADV